MSIKYRPEIDGLRAIAVLSVVIYHASFMLGDTKLVQGGFIGVDIFFVISGYLISKIVLREIQQQQFSFLNFYERRARRILPALLAVMLASIPFALDRLLPLAMQDYSATIVSSLLMISNFWFAASDSYWGEPSALKPFLHTWSLSVEEQFYVFFPIFLLLCWRYAKQLILPIIIFGFTVSLLFAQWSHVNSPESAFFLLPARGWQLFAGAILAQLELGGYAPRQNKLNRLLPAIGLALIIGAIFLFSENTPHPSFITLAPVIGVMLVIRYADSQSKVIRILSTKPMVAIGLISYSLYLWHFPVFAFDRIKNGELATADKAENLILSFALAIASYYLVERPARSKKRITNRFFFSLLALCVTGLLAFNIQSYSSGGLPNRYVNFQQLIEYEHYEYEKDFLSYTCFLHPENLPHDKAFPNCEFNADGKSKPVLMLWGDSNAAHLIPGIRKVYGNDYQLLIRTTSGCGAFVGLEVPKRPGCKDINDDLVILAERVKPEILIIAGLWKPEFPALLEKTLEELQKHQIKNVSVIGPVPRWTGSLPRVLIEYGQRTGPSQTLPKYLQDPRHNEVFNVEKQLIEMTNRVGVQYISLLDMLCIENRGCQTSLDDGKLMQWDYGHLTAAGAEYLVSRWPLEDTQEQ